jgi:hypothetical protein
MTSVDTRPRLAAGSRRVGTVTLALQLVFLVSAAWLAVLYARGLSIAGSRAALGSVRPDSLIPFGMHPANPLAWVHTLAILTALLGVGVGALYAVAGLALSLLSDLRQRVA